MERVRIAVCDDERVDLDYTLELIKRYDTELLMQVDSYIDADSILTSEIDSYDIVLLDIEMPPPTGFEVASMLVSKPNPPVIIFTTKSNAYAVKGYGIAIRYLQKPLVESELFRALDIAIEEVTAHRLTFNINDTMYTIHLCEVRYIEILGHYTSVHTISGQFRIRCSLKELIPKLPRGYFAIPHKSFVVNLEYVRCATKSEVVLEDNIRIPISRRKAPDFNDALYRFLGR